MQRLIFFSITTIGLLLGLLAIYLHYHGGGQLHQILIRFLLVKLPSLAIKLLKPTIPTQPVNWKSHAPRSTSTSTKSSLPNIVLIIADDLGINDLSGGAGVATPNIDSIRNQGINFINTYSGQATCAPSRAAIFTGRHPTKIGFEFTPIPMRLAKAMSIYSPSHPSIPNRFLKENAREAPRMRDMAIPKNVTILPEVLSSHGYQSYLIGKWHLGDNNGSTSPLQRGFDETLVFPYNGLSKYYPTNHPDVVNAPLDTLFDDFLRENMPFAMTFNNGPVFEVDDYMTDYLSNRAVDLIESRKHNEKPMFLALTYSAPHSPLQAKRSDYEDPEIVQYFSPSQFDSQSDSDTASGIDHRRVYAAMIKALDRGVGKVLNALEQMEMLENTLVIFTSDNGGAHYIGVPSVNQPYRGFKGTFYEGGIRVPFFMRWDGYPQLKQVAVFSDPVTHVDLFSTIASVASGKYNTVSPIPTAVPTGCRRSNDKVTFDAIENDIDGTDLMSFVHLHSSLSQPDKSCFLAADEHERALFSDNNMPIDQIRRRPHDYLYWRSGHYRAFRYHSFKLQVLDRPNKVIWHDLETDPFEEINLALSLNISSKLQLEDHMGKISSSNETIQNAFHTCPTGFDKSYNLINLLKIYSMMIEEEKNHRHALWKPLMEIAVPIDKCSAIPILPDDDFVYFEN